MTNSLVAVTKYYRGGDRKQLQALLRESGFRSTEGRLKLLSVLRESGRPMSVHEISGECGKDLEVVNVYRALEALSAAGLLLRTDLRKGGAHYEFKDEHHHHHVTCNECGVSEDVSVCSGASMESRVLRDSRKFARVQTHALEFFGTCNACASH